MSDVSAPLSGRTAIVTGASSGVARAIADRLAAAGVVVFSPSRRREGAAPTAGSGKLCLVELDVRDSHALIRGRPKGQVVPSPTRFSARATNWRVR